MKKKKSVIKRSSVPPGRRLGLAPKARRWLGINETLGLSTLPDPKYTTSEAREQWPGLPVVAQRAVIKMNRDQNRGVEVAPEYALLVLGCGEFFKLRHGCEVGRGDTVVSSYYIVEQADGRYVITDGNDQDPMLWMGSHWGYLDQSSVPLISFASRDQAEHYANVVLGGE